MSDKFAEILNRPLTEIEKPPALPPGTYRAIVQGLPRYDKSSKKQTDFVEFTLRITSAENDVDEGALKAFLTRKDGTMKALTEITMKNTYYITEDAAWRLKKFLADLGFDEDDEEHTLHELCESAANNEVYITVKQRPSQDGKSIFAEVADTARVD